jgi:hypothetical protein
VKCLKRRFHNPVTQKFCGEYTTEIISASVLTRQEKSISAGFFDYSREMTWLYSAQGLNMMSPEEQIMPRIKGLVAAGKAGAT